MDVASAVDWECSLLVARSVLEGVVQEKGLWLAPTTEREVDEEFERVERRRRRFSLPGD